MTYKLRFLYAAKAAHPAGAVFATLRLADFCLALTASQTLIRGSLGPAIGKSCGIMAAMVASSQGLPFYIGAVYKFSIRLCPDVPRPPRPENSNRKNSPLFFLGASLMKLPLSIRVSSLRQDKDRFQQQLW